MLMDRDLIIEVARNVSKFTSEGLPVETRWNSNLQCTFDGWWLDPQSKDFGPNAKYFVRNVPEAKRLMAAAGYASGVDIISSHITTNEYGTDFPKMVEVVEGMMAEGGFRFKKNIVNYASEFIPRYREAPGADLRGAALFGGQAVQRTLGRRLQLLRAQLAYREKL